MAGPFASSLLLGSISLLAATTVPAVAGDDASFYVGKQITFIVGTGAGGGNDLYARVLAPFRRASFPATRPSSCRICQDRTARWRRHMYIRSRRRMAR
jgi:hypothetical protein